MMKKAKATAGEAESVRAFVALDLDAMSVRRIARIAEHLRMTSGAPSAVWTLPAKIHVTLKFIAQLRASAVQPLGDAVGALATGKRAPRAGSLRLEAFPSIAEADIVVVELEDPAKELRELAQRTDRIGAKLGIPKESRAFRPHVTLARLKRSYDARRWLRPELADGIGECRPARLTLYRSVLEPDGSTYTPLARFDFAPE